MPLVRLWVQTGSHLLLAATGCAEDEDERWATGLRLPSLCARYLLEASSCDASRLKSLLLRAAHLCPFSKVCAFARIVLCFYAEFLNTALFHRVKRRWIPNVYCTNTNISCVQAIYVAANAVASQLACAPDDSRSRELREAAYSLLAGERQLRVRCPREELVILAEAAKQRLRRQVNA